MYSKQTGRFVSPDPRIFRSIYEPGAWNLYVYALSNPIGYVGRDGLWPEWIHRAIIEKAFPGLTPTEISEIARGNSEVDVKGGRPITLLSQNSYQHSQTSDWFPTQTSMETKRAEFIASAEAVAKDPANRNANGMGNATANYAFGRSRHPMQDDTSPAHSVENRHYSTPSLLAMALAPVPSSIDFGIGLGVHKWRERKIDPVILDLLVQSERAAYRRIFGQEALQIAMTRRYTYQFVKSQYLWSHLDDFGGYGEIINCTVEGRSCF